MMDVTRVLSPFGKSKVITDYLLSCSSLDDDEEELLLPLLDELLDELDEFDDELESLSLPSASCGGSFTMEAWTGSFFMVIFSLGI